ncbi:MAG: diaminopimelate decarboxylase [Kiritimatiellae bacterium]|nr:diaminopimelate decarboxylase [Kiritimatiellia bacterium]
MNAFSYKNKELHAEQIPVRVLVETHGTPLYIYSHTHLVDQYRALSEAMAAINPFIFYAVKANTNMAVIQAFAQQGAGADVVSGGELYRARRAGVDASKIVFAGVGKSVAEIEYALQEDILYFTVESEPELERISASAQRLGKIGRIAIRVNPDVDPKTHKYTSTGKKENKFGVDLERAVKAYEHAASLPGLEITGVHMHLGSPLMTTAPYVEALEKVRPLCDTLKTRYPSFKHIDIGGGLGINYRSNQNAPTPTEFAEAVVPPLKKLGLTVGIEPGRFLTGNGGILVTRIEYVKQNAFKKFIVADAAMNDLIRPSLYEAYHEVLPVQQSPEMVFGDLVGPICESGDFFAVDRELPDVCQGDLVAIMSAGAYGFVMASNYNSRPHAAEVMVNGTQSECVRKRQTREDLVKGETLPEWM